MSVQATRSTPKCSSKYVVYSPWNEISIQFICLDCILPVVVLLAASLTFPEQIFGVQLAFSVCNSQMIGQTTFALVAAICFSHMHTTIFSGSSSIKGFSQQCLQMKRKKSAVIIAFTFGFTIIHSTGPSVWVSFPVLLFFFVQCYSIMSEYLKMWHLSLPVHIKLR